MKPGDEVWVRAKVHDLHNFTDARIQVELPDGRLDAYYSDSILPAPPDLRALAEEVRNLEGDERCEQHEWIRRASDILRALAAYAKEEQEPRAERMEYHFRRYRGNQLMAEEVYVHAHSEEEARSRALLHYNNAEDMGRLELIGAYGEGGEG